MSGGGRCGRRQEPQADDGHCQMLSDVHGLFLSSPPHFRFRFMTKTQQPSECDAVTDEKQVLAASHEPGAAWFSQFHVSLVSPIWPTGRSPPTGTLAIQMKRGIGRAR